MIEDEPTVMSRRAMSLPLLQTATVGLLLAACHFLMTVNDPFSTDDQGLQYLLSRTWARGESLFAGWDPLYVLGQYSYFGTFMRVLGEGVWVHRLAGSLLVGTSAAVLFRAVRREGGLVLGLGVALMPLLAAKPQGPTLLAMSLVASAALRVARPDPLGRLDVCVLAIMAGLMFGWREDSAVLATVIALAAAVRSRRLLEGLAIAVGGLGVGVSLWLLVVTAQNESITASVGHVAHRVGFLVARLFAPTITIANAAGAEHAGALRTLGGAVTPLLVATPLVFYLWLLWSQAAHWHRGHAVNGGVAGAALVGLAYWPQFGWERPDVFHFVTHLPVFVLVMACLAATWVPASRRRFAWLLCIGAAGILTVRAAETRLQLTAPYPTPAAHRIGARVRVPVVEWANLPRSEGDTLIVLGFAPGVYVLEDYPAGTGLLSTHVRVLARPEKTAQLKADLLRPSVRWVIGPVDPLVPSEWLTADVGAFLLRHFEHSAPDAPNGLWKRRRAEPGS